MTSTSHKNSAATGEPTIAGYVLKERLGEGGYGTVYRAIGPGGLPKAVKVMRGRFDGHSADTELKALNRMRELRHPFVLSVERIEVIDDQLIIVTELAEGSLQDRFDKLKAGGTRGIPYEELIGYLRDAADALDFMFQQHGLQHLDIKPGNLLTQGGHLKIADFGLLKDVRQTQQSLVSGFTPLYAPPELFEGRPGSCSDQYSLAIVYQTMLTGMPPYNGRTAAQLASQHLSSSPDLSPLPNTDRPAIARALSKNPEARFRTCREFVEVLIRGRQKSEIPRASASAASIPPRPNATAEWLSIDAVAARPSEPAAPPPLAAPRHRPQIVVGLGGLATAILLAYRERCAARFQRAQGLPAFPVLAVDTDARSLADFRRAAGPGNLGDGETLSLPLRDLKDYRESSGKILDWLGRRWLYNLPRSRQVEGMRPLGRLAFVDNADMMRRRLLDLIKSACSEASLAAASEAMKSDFGNCPEIVLVAATQGGTGSGAVLDAAYLARSALKQLGLDGTVTGVLLHGTSVRDRSRAVPTAGTIACLREWAHYAASGYVAELPAGTLECEQPPFDHTYLVHLGEGLNDDDLHVGATRVAEYLYRSAVTPARAFVDAVRRPNEAENAETVSLGPMLRTFGLLRAAGGAGDATEAEADLCLHVARHWRSAPPPSAESQATASAWVSKALHELRLEFDPVLGMASTVMSSDLGKAFQTFVTQRVEQLPPKLVDAAVWQRQVQSDFRAPSADTPLNHPGAMLHAVAAQIKTWAVQCGEALVARLFTAALEGTAGIDVVSERLVEAMGRLKSLSSELGKAAASGAVSSDAVARTQVVEAANDPRAVVRAAYHHWFGAGLIACLIEGIKDVSRAVELFGEELSHLRQRLDALEAAWRPDRQTAEHETARPGSDERSALESLAPKFAQRLHQSNALSLKTLIAADDDAVRAWTESLIGEARKFLGERGIDEFGDLDAETARGVGLRPRLNDVGGCHRVLLTTCGAEPTTTRSRLMERFGDCVSTVTDSHEAPCIVCEADGLEVGAVISRLAAGDARVLEYAGQLMTRRDVDWVAPQSR